jgi:PleD family two-component response regulator
VPIPWRPCNGLPDRFRVTESTRSSESEGRSRPIVLVANDQEWSARSLESILVPEGYEVVRAYTGRQALDRAREVLPDVIVLDAQMPDLDGFEICRQLRADLRFDAVTPIFITTAGPAGRERRIEAFRAGAWAFYGQPLDGDILLCQFRTFIASKRAFDDLNRGTMTDPVTGLYNLRGIHLRAREIASDARRHGAPMACVVLSPNIPDGLELNGLGERIAKRIGQLLRGSGRSADAIGRVDSLEFVVVAPYTGPAGAEKLAQRFDSLLQATSTDEDTALLSGPLRLRTAYCTVPDGGKPEADAVELVSRTRAALDADTARARSS